SRTCSHGWTSSKLSGSRRRTPPLREARRRRPSRSSVASAGTGRPMAKKAKRAPPAEAEEPADNSGIANKIAGALALIAVKGMDKDDASLALNAIGFTVNEISGLLDVNKNYVMLARFRKKNAGKKARKKKA